MLSQRYLNSLIVASSSIRATTISPSLAVCCSRTRMRSRSLIPFFSIESHFARRRCCYLCRYRNICFNIFFCIDRCTTGNTSEERDIERHLSFIIGNTEIELSSFFSNKISLLYKTVHKKLDRSRRGIS